MPLYWSIKQSIKKKQFANIFYFNRLSSFLKFSIKNVFIRALGNLLKISFLNIEKIDKFTKLREED